MTHKIKEWATIGGLILLGILAMAGWRSRQDAAASACAVHQSGARKHIVPMSQQKHSGSIGALSEGAAGFVK